MRAFAKQCLIFTAALFACLAYAAAVDLPRVMILGDELFAPAAAEFKKTLDGKAVVVHVKVPDDLPPTAESALAAFDRIVGKEKWDVIHFNFGLGELAHRAPGMKSFRVMSKRAGGIPSASPEEYEKHLEALVQRLVKTGARLIWASTPPITNASPQFLVPGSEVAFNQRAAAIMARHRIPVNDLHAFVMANPDGQKNRLLLLAPITEIISRELNLR